MCNVIKKKELMHMTASFETSVYPLICIYKMKIEGRIYLVVFRIVVHILQDCKQFLEIRKQITWAQITEYMFKILELTCS
jgi:hypothetical protein